MAEALQPEVVAVDSPEGGSGVAFLGGTLFRREDYNVALQGQQGCLIYEQMRRGDPDIASGLARLLQPILSKNFEFKPGEDTERGREIAKFCTKWILGEGRTDPFAMNKQAFLRHAFLMLSDGMSAFEKVWGRDREGRDVYAELIPILPKTIVEFQFSNTVGGQLEYAKQRAYILGKGFTDAKIRAEKLMLFVFGREGNNLFGWPILRACYKPWLHKEQLEIIDGIRIERNGIGFFVITIPKGSKASVREAAMAVASQIRVHERQGVIVEEGTKVEILYPTGNDPKIVESINLRRVQILQVLISEFMEHGTTSIGSKALVGSKMDFLLMCLQGLVDEACDVVNKQAVPELVGRNWGWNEPLPTLACEDMARMTAGELAEFFSKTAPHGAVDVEDPEIQQYTRKAAHLPEIPEKDMKVLREAHDARLKQKVELAKQPPMIPGAPGAGGGAPPAGGKPTPQKPAPAPDPEEAERKPAALWREPLQHERYVDFGAMKAYLTEEPKRVWAQVVEPLRDEMAKVTAHRIARMEDEIYRKGRVAIPWQDKLTEAIVDPLAAAYVRGRTSVLLERARQRMELAAAEDPIEDEEIDVEPGEESRDWIKTLAAGFVIGMLKSMEKRAFDVSGTARDQELAEAAHKQLVEDELRELSKNVLQVEMATYLNRSFQFGRKEQATALASEIETCFYSAIMDDGTEACAEKGGLCADLDGDEFEFGDPRYEVPSPFCAWTPSCRCSQVHIFRKEAA